MRLIIISIFTVILISQPLYAKEKKIKYWTDPMDPTYISDKPGKSPMGMDTVPVYEGDDDSGGGTVKIDPVIIQDIGVRTTKVKRGAVHTAIRTVGNITYDEERVRHVHTKVSGWVERLHVNTTGETVRKNQTLLSIYSPELVSTQQEFLEALNYKKTLSNSTFPEILSGAESLVESAKKRLLLMDITEDQIDELQKNGKVRKNLELVSPISGTVINKPVLEGMKIEPGTDLYVIADLSKVWVIASVYEYEFPFLRIGQEAEVTLSYEPGVMYKGRVTFIYPFLSTKTRTVQVRIALDNPRQRLKPDMYTNVVIRSRTKESGLIVPSEAVLKTGQRNVVVASLGSGKFLPKEVTIGAEGNGYVQILNGLKDGDTIVTSGQFLIDSESKLREVINKMLEAKKSPITPNPSKSEIVPPMTLKLDAAQAEIMSEILTRYIEIHDALASESLDKIMSGAVELSKLTEKMQAASQDKELTDFIITLKNSTKGLTSNNLKTARDAFIPLSRAMVAYAKGLGKDSAALKNATIYVCTMLKEPWIQKSGKVQNPYLGKDMLSCGVAESSLGK